MKQFKEFACGYYLIYRITNSYVRQETNYLPNVVAVSSPEHAAFELRAKQAELSRRSQSYVQGILFHIRLDPSKIDTLDIKEVPIPKVNVER